MLDSFAYPLTKGGRVAELRSSPVDASSLAQRLARYGEKLPASVRADILEQGQSAVAELSRIVEDEELALEGSVGDGWMPIHAADLLLDLLAQLGMRDERVFTWCKEYFDRQPALGSISFADYGDERALPLLRRAIEEFEPHWDSPLGIADLTDYVDSYERLAGDLLVAAGGT